MPTTNAVQPSTRGSLSVSTGTPLWLVVKHRPPTARHPAARTSMLVSRDRVRHAAFLNLVDAQNATRS